MFAFFHTAKSCVFRLFRFSPDIPLTHRECFDSLRIAICILFFLAARTFCLFCQILLFVFALPCDYVANAKISVYYSSPPPNLKWKLSPVSKLGFRGYVIIDGAIKFPDLANSISEGRVWTLGNCSFAFYCI